jgi:Kef-type K+ transport system membrane component KefB
VSPILQLLLILCIILVAAKMSGLIALRLGQPAVLGELAAGVILGPSVIDIFSLDFVGDPHMEETIHLMAELGVIFLMFLAGLETDLAEVNKVRKVAIFAGTMGVVAPIALGFFGTLPYGYPAKESFFIGIILSATSVSISARTLMELGVLQGRQGISILAAAVIDDVLGILVLSVFIAFAASDGGGGAIDVVWIVLRMGLFFTVAFLVGHYLLPFLSRWTQHAPITEGVLAMAIVVALFGAWFAEYVGEVAMITGSFLAGVFLRRTGAHHVIEERMHALSYGFFVPIFFVGVGLQADAGELSTGDIGLLMVICVIAIGSKVIGCGLGAYAGGEDFRSSLQIGTGMISRGEVGLIVASVGLSKGIIQSDLFAIMVLMVLVTTLATPILLKIVFAQPREVQHA